jgi:hypothetical protein
MERLSPEGLSPEVLAALIAAEIAEVYSPAIDEKVRDGITARLETALHRIARQEREACVAVCLQRRAMWEATENRATIVEPLRSEARFRGNEAAVIADALRVL